MEIKGRIVELLQEVSGQGRNGTWRKQEFILETQDQFPKKVCIALWGDRIDEFNVQTGETVTAYINIESREYNGRWYTDIKAWRIDREQAGSSSLPPEEHGNAPAEMPPPDNDLPF